MALTKNDIEALKQASVITFHQYQGRSYVRCVKKIRDKVFGESEQEYEIDCEGALGYAEYWASGNQGFYAYYYEGCAKQDSALQTIISLLRPDYSLRLIWNADGWRNQYAEEADLHVDALILQVCKPDGKFYCFNVGFSVCPMNSARMIKP
jgi:hypothetical protein